MAYADYEIRKACKELLRRNDWTNAYAVTAHLKERFIFRQKHELDDLRTRASENNRYFFTRLDYRIFGNRTKPQRGGLKTTRIAAIEDGAERVHCHFLIKCPPEIDLSQMEAFCRESWLKTPYGVSGIQVLQHKVHSETSHFGTYIMKQVTANSTDALDYPNIHLS